jgi:hypothetical protein
MNLKKNFGIVGLVLFAVVLTGALIGAGFLQNGLQAEPNDKKNSDTAIVGTGTVVYLEFEGGFFGIISDDNEQYLPYELSEEYQEDGLRISFTVEPLEDQMSFHMWGTLVDIVEIETIG